MRVVLDANILGGGLPATMGTLFKLFQAFRAQQFELVYSTYLITELVGMWSKPYWEKRLTPDFMTRSIAAIRRQGTLVAPSPGVNGVATHWQDDLVIATAVAGNAEYLVTGDKELLSVKAYRNVRIVSPLEFLEVLQAESDEEADD